MTMPPIICYEALVSAYATSLTTVLRGFKSAEAFEFLETWVPDDDPGRSIFGIIEAAKDAGLPSLVIGVTQETLQGLDVARLSEQTGRIGQLHVERNGPGADLKVSFQRQPPTVDIHPAYRERLRPWLERCAHQGALAPDAGRVLAQASADGVTLAVLADPATHVVERAAYQGTVTRVQRGLLEILCEGLVGHPVLEGSDHAAIRLEYALRDPAQPPPVPGVVTPQNADPVFALPLQLIRAAFAEYRRITGYQDTRNMYDRATSPAWRALAPAQRAARLQEAISRHPDGGGVRVLRLDGLERVVLVFSEPADPEEKPRRLLRLEAHLKAAIEPALHIYLEPKWDENRPRQTKGVKL